MNKRAEESDAAASSPRTCPYHHGSPHLTHGTREPFEVWCVTVASSTEYRLCRRRNGILRLLLYGFMNIGACNKYHGPHQTVCSALMAGALMADGSFGDYAPPQTTKRWTVAVRWPPVAPAESKTVCCAIRQTSLIIYFTRARKLACSGVIVTRRLRERSELDLVRGEICARSALKF